MEVQSSKGEIRVAPGTYGNVVVMGGDLNVSRIELSGAFTRDEIEQAIVVLQQIASVMK